MSKENQMEWNPFMFREPDEEEKQEHPDWDDIVDNIPEVDETIIVSDGKRVWTDSLLENSDGAVYLDSNEDIADGMAWMYLPKPYKGGKNENTD